jgi:hypothetical protein
MEEQAKKIRSSEKAYCGLGEWHDESCFHFRIVNDVYVVQYRD